MSGSSWGECHEGGVRRNRVAWQTGGPMGEAGAWPMCGSTTAGCRPKMPWATVRKDIETLEHFVDEAAGKEPASVVEPCMKNLLRLADQRAPRGAHHVRILGADSKNNGVDQERMS